MIGKYSVIPVRITYLELVGNYQPLPGIAPFIAFYDNKLERVNENKYVILKCESPFLNRKCYAQIYAQLQLRSVYAKTF